MGRVSDARERLIEATIELVWQQSYGAATVDAICERSGVKKGSFYHFFKSKDELVVAALEAHWESRRPVLDRLFSPTVPPLERLERYFAHVRQRQLDLRRRSGRFLGCFYSAVGSEVCRQSPEINRTVQEILAQYTRYYESALRDAVAQKKLRCDDVEGRARSLFAFMEGVLAQARISDDPALIEDLGRSALAFLGGRRAA